MDDKTITLTATEFDILRRFLGETNTHLKAPMLDKICETIEEMKAADAELLHIWLKLDRLMEREKCTRD